MRNSILLLVILLMLTTFSCSNRLFKDRVYISYDKLYGDISDGMPEKDTLTTVNDIKGTLLGFGRLAMYDKEISEIKVGFWKEFYSNGKLKSEGNYKIGSYIDCCMGGSCRSFYNYRAGNWKYYNKKGEFDFSVVYTPTSLHINTRCEEGDSLVYGLISDVPVEFVEKITADKIYELQKISVTDLYGGTTLFIPINGELKIEIKINLN